MLLRLGATNLLKAFTIRWREQSGRLPGCPLWPKTLPLLRRTAGGTFEGAHASFGPRVGLGWGLQISPRARVISSPWWESDLFPQAQASLRAQAKKGSESFLNQNGYGCNKVYKGDHMI